MTVVKIITRIINFFIRKSGKRVVIIDDRLTRDISMQFKYWLKPPKPREEKPTTSILTR